MAVTAGSSEGGQNNNFMQQQQRNAFTYRVELDGTVELPEVGAVQLAGLTLDEASAKSKTRTRRNTLNPMHCSGWEQPRLGLSRRGRSSHGDHPGKPKHNGH